MLTRYHSREKIHPLMASALLNKFRLRLDSMSSLSRHHSRSSQKMEMRNETYEQKTSIQEKKERKKEKEKSKKEKTNKRPRLRTNSARNSIKFLYLLSIHPCPLHHFSEKQVPCSLTRAHLDRHHVADHSVCMSGQIHLDVSQTSQHFFTRLRQNPRLRARIN